MRKPPKNSHITAGSEKSFGVVFAIVFLVIACYPLVTSQAIHIWAMIIALLFLLCAYFQPKILIIPNKAWFKFGMFLGSIIAPIVMFIVYSLSVFPVGFIMRLAGKDLLNLKFNSNAKTYWIKRDAPIGPMKNQF